jgi:hypothetical protein
MKTSVIIVICILIQNVTFAQNAKGCIPDIIDTNMVMLKDFSGLRAPLPSSYSLEAYAPAVGDQGILGSCTSWATNYCAFTMVKRIESGNNYLTPFSALDLHNRIKASNSEPPCSDGARISEALQILQSYGAGRDYYSYHLQKLIETKVMAEGAISLPTFCAYNGKTDGRFLFIQ